MKYCLKLLLLLELVLIIAWFLGEKFLSIRTETFLGKGLGEPRQNSLVWSRANFDGFYYTKIARDGYQYLQQAFFPLYSKLIKFFHPVFKSYIVSGLFISHSCFILAIWLLFKLLRLNEAGKTVKKTLLMILLFPTSFYFLSVYTESLFLLLIILSFWFAKKKKWLLAGIAAGFASYTRLVGVFLWPALIVEYFETNQDLIKRVKIKAGETIKNLVSLIFLPPMGLIFYMNYLYRTIGDPLYFIKVQPGFGAQRSVSRIIMIYQVFWRYLKMIWTVDKSDPIYFTVWLEFSIALLFLGLLIWGWLKRKELKLNYSYLVFATMAYVLPTLTGTFSSLPRYVLVCFPCFLIIGRIFADLEKKKGLSRIRIVYLTISLILLIICSGMFFRGYWIG